MWIHNICLAITAINLMYWVVIYSRFAVVSKKNRTYGQINKPVSVIICAHNEESALSRNLPFVLNQKYPQFEVIVIDDHSTDGSRRLLEELAAENDKLKFYSLSGPWEKGKKGPLKEGIMRAANDLLLLTDADCKPASPHWLLHMASASRGKNFLLGYGAYEKRTGLLNVFIRFETVITAMQYFSYALSGLPYMGVGRNLGYRKSEFLKTDQFASHMQLLSGDDDLHVNRHAKAGDTAIVFHPDSHTVSIPAVSWPQYIRQKARHYSTAAHYSVSTKLLLGIHQLSLFGFYLTLLVLAIFSLPLACKIYLARLLVVWFIFTLTAVKLKEWDLPLYFPLAEPALLIFFLYQGPSLIRNAYEW